ncbi:MAG: TIM barrel protein [Bacteroidetes bacterium]|nr:TIM barrel protein [Bacteroidota bacterium]MCY4205549.1 TIM barrel protein [Bacteroidota bacterium]
MTRREFIPSVSLAATAAAGLGYSMIPENRKNFSLHYAPHFGMFKHSAGEDLVDQLNFAADQGFTAWEDNGMKGRSKGTQERIANTMVQRNMRMGVFVAHTIFWNKPNLASGDADLREQFLKEIEESVEVAKRVNATWMTVVPGFVDLRLDMGYQTAHVIESLRRASDILEPHDLVMVLEPLNPHNHPGLFLTKIPQAYEVCRSVNSPACKILNDLYHQQITEGNLIPNINTAWDEIAYYQIGDNPGRKEPTTGEINYKNVFSHIRQKGFEGILGMEHGNMHPGQEGEKALIQAYRTVDGSGS